MLIKRVRPDGEEKMLAFEWAKSKELVPGQFLGS